MFCSPSWQTELHCLLIVLIFDAIQVEIVVASLNKPQKVINMYISSEKIVKSLGDRWYVSFFYSMLIQFC